MKLRIKLFALLLLFAVVARAQVPVEQLAKPPANAEQFTILSVAGTHGHTFLWTTPDGSRVSRESVLLRGQVFELEQKVKYGADGMLAALTTRGFTPSGDAAETFAVANGVANWKSAVDAGQRAYTAPAFYVSQVNITGALAELLEALLKSPDKSLPLLPGGRARAGRLAELTVGSGTARKTVIAYAISGLAPSPVTAWSTFDGKFFAIVDFLSSMPVGYEGEMKRMHQAQDEALATRSPALVKSLLKTPSGPVAFTHVCAFVNGNQYAEDQTVIITNGLITAVGPAASVAVPGGAQRINGSGKTLVPGLWDSHMHVGDDSTGPFLLSLGVTSARDPGNNNALTIARAGRRARGELLLPTVYPSALIDGQGPNTAQVGTSVASLDEALAAVRKAREDNFTGIKLYGTFKPEWVAPTAAEAHKLGLHVHGHIPAGMRPSEAISAGYDEITHINFVMMEAMPDSVVATSNGINRFKGPGRYAKDIDIQAPPLAGLIATMAAKKITSDPTLSAFESLYVPENGDLSPAYAPYVGTLPPVSERGFRQGGFAVPKDLTREDYRRSFARMVALLGEMHAAGVPIVAGTDGSGAELVRELELYVQAGLTPEEALETATIAPARLQGVDATTGSIAVGKVADVVLVEGDPSRHVGDLRNTRIVVMGGKLMDADALREASGFSGRPHPAE